MSPKCQQWTLLNDTLKTTARGSAALRRTAKPTRLAKCFKIRFSGSLFFRACSWGPMRSGVSRPMWPAQDVKIEATPGMLTDHYDPRTKILRLSQDVYFTPSVAAAGIAAHEAGHAVQDAEDYLPMEARTYIVPVVQLASRIAPWLFVAGLMLQMPSLTWAGVILFGSSSLVAFLTLPVELNASSRAEQLLVSQGIIRGDEQIAGVQNVLGAAAWTYVAAAVSALGSWLFYVVLLVSQTRATTDRS
jgi:Zn-dependent membrane protease YugP